MNMGNEEGFLESVERSLRYGAYEFREGYCQTILLGWVFFMLFMTVTQFLEPDLYSQLQVAWNAVQASAFFGIVICGISCWMIIGDSLVKWPFMIVNTVYQALLILAFVKHFPAVG